MLIENVLPEIVAEKSTVPERLIAEGISRGIPREEIDQLLLIVPPTIAQAGAFLDKMTGIWRYEFGLPYQLDGSLVWGTHMWEHVDHLFDALRLVLTRVSEKKRAGYLRNLADLGKHQETLVEMIPATRVSSDVPLDFETAGLGIGNRTVDWVVGPHEERRVLCDVKRRTRDFLEQFSRIDDSPHSPEPEHDPSLLFRSVEQKFLPNNPASCLQGAWIVTDIPGGHPDSPICGHLKLPRP